MISHKIVVVFLAILIVNETTSLGIFEAPAARIKEAIKYVRYTASEGFKRVRAAVDIGAKAFKDAARVIAAAPVASLADLKNKHPEVLKLVTPSVDQMLVEYTEGVEGIVRILLAKIDSSIRNLGTSGQSVKMRAQLRDNLESLDRVLTDMIAPMIITQQSPLISLNNILIEFRKRLARILSKPIPHLCKIRKNPVLGPFVSTADIVSRNLFIVSQQLTFEKCPGSNCADLDIIVNRIVKSINCVDMSG